jgi:AcrR family transcriptional regulator
VTVGRHRLRCPSEAAAFAEIFMTGTAKGIERSRHATRGKTGRPARLDREMIARAAYEIGLDRVTMKAVADKLGVSVPGLYHHVEGRDDLMQLAAEYSASRIRLPEDRGQSWAEWLLEWSRVSHYAFLAQPELLIQSMRGSMSVDRMVIHVDAVTGFLMQRGFTPIEARDAYTLVSRCAIGAAISEIRQSESGRGLLAEYHRVLSARTPDELPNLRRLVAVMQDDGPTLDEQICTVLVGIAVRRGEPWKPILELARPTQVAKEFESLHP